MLYLFLTHQGNTFTVIPACLLWPIFHWCTMKRENSSFRTLLLVTTWSITQSSFMIIANLCLAALETQDMSGTSSILVIIRPPRHWPRTSLGFFSSASWQVPWTEVQTVSWWKLFNHWYLLFLSRVGINRWPYLCANLGHEIGHYTGRLRRNWRMWSIYPNGPQAMTDAVLSSACPRFLFLKPRNPNDLSFIFMKRYVEHWSTLNASFSN